MKSPIPLCIFAPFFFMAWCGLTYWKLGTVDKSMLYSVAGITAIMWSFAACAIFLQRKTISDRVHIDVKPNVIEVADGEHFTASFSTGGRFLSNPGKFSSALRDAANRKSHMGNRSVAYRESAHVRLWPGELGISELELEAFTQLVEIEFLEPTIEVIDSGISGSDHQTAIRV